MKDGVQEKGAYDGIYFYTTVNTKNSEEAFNVVYFKVDDVYDSNPIENTKLGDMFHIAFFDYDDGKLFLSESFEAILGSPEEYVKSFSNTNLIGCLLRKTKTSELWFKECLNNYKRLLMGKIYAS